MESMPQIPKMLVVTTYTFDYTDLRAIETKLENKNMLPYEKVRDEIVKDFISFQRVEAPMKISTVRLDGGTQIVKNAQLRSGVITLFDEYGKEAAMMRLLRGSYLSTGIRKIVVISTEITDKEKQTQVIREAAKLGAEKYIEEVLRQNPDRIVRYVAAVLAPDTEIKADDRQQTIFLLKKAEGISEFVYPDKNDNIMRLSVDPEHILVSAQRLKLRRDVLLNDSVPENHFLFGYWLNGLKRYYEQRRESITLDDFRNWQKDGGNKRVQTMQDVANNLNQLLNNAADVKRVLGPRSPMERELAGSPALSDEDVRKIMSDRDLVETLKEFQPDEFKKLQERMTKITSAASNADGGDSVKAGGIDFRGLPIVNQSGALPLPVGINQLPSVNIADLDGEWLQIEKMTESEMVPSTQRLKEFLGACCSKGALDKYAGNVLACIADIMRMEEEKAQATEPALREILILLESNQAENELQQSLSFIAVTAGQPQA